MANWKEISQRKSEIRFPLSFLSPFTSHTPISGCGRGRKSKPGDISNVHASALTYQEYQKCQIEVYHRGRVWGVSVDQLPSLEGSRLVLLFAVENVRDFVRDNVAWDCRRGDYCISWVVWTVRKKEKKTVVILTCGQ